MMYWMMGEVKLDPSQPLEYRINDTFSVTGVGTVVAGTVMSGILFRDLYKEWFKSEIYFFLVLMRVDPSLQLL